MNSEYKHHAYQRAVATALMRVIQRDFLPSDVSEQPRVPIICEEVAMSESQVPKEAVRFFFNRLGRIVRDEEIEMATFEMVKRSNGEKKPEVEEAPQEEVGAEKPRPRRAKGKRKSRGGTQKARG